MTMKTTTTYIRYYFDRGEWKMTKDRCVLRTGRGLDSAIAAEKELRAKGVPMRFLFIEGWKALNGLKNKRNKVRLTQTNKRAKALFYCIAVIYDIICNISEILYIIYYLKKSKSNVKIYNIIYFSQNK